MSNKNQFLVTVSVDGVPVQDPFDTHKGGAVDSEETKYRSGGGGPEESLGGSAKMSNITVGRLYKLPRDQNLSRRLWPRIGKARAAVSFQPIDADNVPFGEPDVRGGVLKMVTPPEFDANGTGAATFDMEISVDGVIG